MKRQPLKSAPPTGCGAVRSDEVLSLREFGRRLGLGVHCLCLAQRDGLPTILIGRVKFVLGSEVLAWFARQGEQQRRDRQFLTDMARQAVGGNGDE